MISFFKKILHKLSLKNFCKKSLWKITLTSLVIGIAVTLICSLNFYINNKDVYKDELVSIYESIPNFSLSQNGLSVDGDDVYDFSFGGVNIYIDDNSELTKIVTGDLYNSTKEYFILAKDGYGELANGVLESGNFFKDTTVLEDVVLTKSDFIIFESIIELVSKDILFFNMIKLLFALIFTQIILMFTLFVTSILLTRLLKQIVPIVYILKQSLVLSNVFIVVASIIFVIDYSKVTQVASLCIYIATVILNYILASNYYRQEVC